jgi:hypothetical protein
MNLNKLVNNQIRYELETLMNACRTISNISSSVIEEIEKLDLDKGSAASDSLSKEELYGINAVVNRQFSMPGAGGGTLESQAARALAAAASIKTLISISHYSNG